MTAPREDGPYRERRERPGQQDVAAWVRSVRFRVRAVAVVLVSYIPVSFAAEALVGKWLQVLVWPVYPISFFLLTLGLRRESCPLCARPLGFRGIARWLRKGDCKHCCHVLRE